MGTTKFSTIACYSALTTVNDDIDIAFMSFVLILVSKKDYRKIEINSLCKDFLTEFGFELPYFPMQRIIDTATKKGYFSYNRFAGYTPVMSKIREDSFMQEIERQNEQYEKLICAFVDFTNQSRCTGINKEIADTMLSNFVEENGIVFFSDKRTYFNNSKDDFIIAEFLEHIRIHNTSLFNYVDSLVIGRILTEFIAYSEPKESISSISTTVYIDVGIAFCLLGIDSLHRKQFYISLINDIRSNGFSVKMFDHTYAEMTGIIENSAQWINNPLYDVSKASECTYYFVTNNISRDEIIQMANNAQENLTALGIEIEPMVYPQKSAPDVLYEQDYYEKIKEYYASTNPDFNEDSKKFTIQQDARSLFYIDHLSNGLVASNFQDLRYVFITTNRSLAKINKLILQKRCALSRARFIPTCVTDVFWGTFIWYNNPVKLYSISKNRVSSAIYAAMQPSDKLLAKLNASLNTYMLDETLSPEQCYVLKTNSLAISRLMDLTLGDDRSFDSSTPLEIIQSFKEEGRHEERNKATSEINQASIFRLEERIENLRNEELLYERLIIINEDNIHTQNQLKDEQLKNKEKAEKAISKSIRNLQFAFVCIIILYALTGVYVWYKGLLDIFSFLMPIVGLLISYSYFWFLGKEFNVFKWTENYHNRKLDTFYKKYSYNLYQTAQIDSKINELRVESMKYHNQLDDIASNLRNAQQEILDIESANQLINVNFLSRDKMTF